MSYFLTMAEEATKLHSQDEQFHRRVKELTAMAKKTAELTDTTLALAQVHAYRIMMDTYLMISPPFLEHSVHQ